MPRWLRILLTGLSFLMFFIGGVLLGGLVAPFFLLLGLGNRAKQRDRVTRLLNRSYGLFLWWMRFAGLIGWQRRIGPPEELRGRPYVLVANHPSLIDVLYLLNWFPGLTCVVKASWYRVWFFGTLLRGTHYLPGPGVEGDDEGEGHRPLERMVEQLREGHPLLVFPEGTRSKTTRMRRFRRGPFEAARQAGVPIVPVFVQVDRPFLQKNMPFWKVPKDRVRWSFERLPTIDPADYPNGRELRNAVQADFERRFEQALQQRLEGPRSKAGERAQAEAESTPPAEPPSSGEGAEAHGGGPSQP